MTFLNHRHLSLWLLIRKQKFKIYKCDNLIEIQIYGVHALLTRIWQHSVLLSILILITSKKEISVLKFLKVCIIKTKPMYPKMVFKTKDRMLHCQILVSKAWYRISFSITFLMWSQKMMNNVTGMTGLKI